MNDIHCDKHSLYYEEYSECPWCANERLRAHLADAQERTRYFASIDLAILDRLEKENGSLIAERDALLREKEEREWVLTRDKKPPVNQPVLATGFLWGKSARGRWTTVLELDRQGHWLAPDGDDQEEYRPPTHWMPLPELPSCGRRVGVKG